MHLPFPYLKGTYIKCLGGEVGFYYVLLGMMC